jgi:hypothetical protein
MTWVLPELASLNPDLILRNDVGGHWIISPRVKMPFDTYLEHLRGLESKSVRHDQLELPTDASGDTHTKDLDGAVPPVAHHRLKEVRFVSSAIAQVYHDRTPIAGWDENDYAYIGLIAEGLIKGALRLEDVQWSSGTVGSELGDQHTTKAARFVAIAVGTHIKTRRDPTLERDTSEEADMLIDTRYLRDLLKFNDARNPLVVYNSYFKEETVEEA